VTLKDWVQLAFGLSNGLSFGLTIRHTWKAKVAGAAVLLVAHPGIAVYFVVTGQPVFLLGNAIMTGAGVYGVVLGLRARRRRNALRQMTRDAAEFEGRPDEFVATR
jgi:hypothetical protein